MTNRKITIQLRLMFRYERDESPELVGRSSGGMSLRDKMGMWGRKLGQDDLEADKSDLFEGVEDDDDDFGHHDLSKYSETIVTSAAYKWLVDKLVKESSFHWDTSQPRIMVERIKQQIMAKLPQGKISGRKEPNTYTVSFRLPLRPLQLRIQEEKLSRWGGGSKQQIFDFVVLAGSSWDHIQATTVKDYFYQTWANNGEVLSSIQDVMDGMSRSICSKTPLPTICYESQLNTSAVLQLDKTRIDIILDEFALVLTVVGPSHSIAECGEQLAWLGAALQPSRSCNALYSTPYLTPGVSEDPNQYHWAIGFDNEERDTSLMPIIHLGDGLARPVIACGFPTHRRPDTCPGIEVSPRILFGLLGTPELELANGTVLLQGPNCALKLVKRTNGVLLWHVHDPLEAACSCSLRLSFIRNIVDLRSYRHILEPCIGAEGAGSSHSVADTSHCLREKLHFPGGAMEESTPAGTCDAVTISRESSLDSDMLSISDGSENACITASHETTLSPIFNTVLRRLLSEYRSDFPLRLATINMDIYGVPGFVTRGGDDCTPTHDTTPLRTTSSSSSAQKNNAPSRKRGRIEDNSDENDADGVMPPPKIARVGQRERRLRLLACPFWKHDFAKHGSCSRNKMDKISRIKQHITRKHTPSFYCECCLVVFQDAASHTRHVRHESCTWDPSIKLDGISHQQQRELTRKSKHTISESEQWFAIWDILFPGQPRPASAYMDPDLSEDLCRFREFAQNHGSQVLLDVLQASGIPVLSEEAIGSDLQKLLNLGLDRLHEEWLLTHASQHYSTSSSSGTSQRIRHDAPSSSLADSGVSCTASQTRSYGENAESLLSNSPRPFPFHTQNPTPSEQAAIPRQIIASATSVTADDPSLSGRGEIQRQATMDRDRGDFGALDSISDLLNDVEWMDTPFEEADFDDLWKDIGDVPESFV